MYPIVGGGTTAVTERLKLQNLSPLATKAALTVDANLIDLVFAYSAGAYGSFDQPIPQPPGQITRAGFDAMTLNSTGDIRVQSGGGGSRQLTLNAAQVYPVSSTNARLAATECPTASSGRCPYLRPPLIKGGSCVHRWATCCWVPRA